MKNSDNEQIETSMNRNPKKSLKNQQNKPSGVGKTQIIQPINATIIFFLFSTIETQCRSQVIINSSRSNGALLISVDNGAADHYSIRKCS